MDCIKLPELGRSYALSLKRSFKEVQDEFYRRAYIFLRSTTSTPMETKKPLLKDEDGVEVDAAYADSDYAGASLDRKYTTKGCQFLGCRLISWKCKKQLWWLIPQLKRIHSYFQSLKIGCLEWTRKAAKDEIGISAYNLNVSAIKATAKAKNINEEAQIHTKVDGKKVIISEEIVRRDLKFEDEGGVDCLSNEVIFKQLTPMGVLDLETTKANQAMKFDSLKRRVKMLEKKQWSRAYKLKRIYKVGLSERIESFDEEQSLDQERYNDEEMFDKSVLDDDEFVEKEFILKEAQDVQILLKIPISSKVQDKGKCIMVEEPLKMKKKDQISFDHQEAIRLQAEIDEEESLAGERAILIGMKVQQEKEANIALIETWHEVDADDQEAAELKRCLEIVPDDGDEVTIDATPLFSKSSIIVDYKIGQKTA
nr:ribonuclease H-like domain, reverse transcriptase, RNA-dependent DNA polymerase [Tanacetum cinerariifolium]GEX37352.1 ribonuclease H-like domain, reverse transcriptase, RNA-dependent DNA polymerase [Tanacetum cinerariifolium]GEX37356.1 ribonuclease H-like domain, reverse transcriptase, RNA-dependent DNA polymerase [Tanacetum cinerariifolium]GEX37365.1 ribonuclease H-like domain, reverse transcriptase, RNA-dependent DNA polymerase [Tanacetum cinerariifolium]GEX37370.1 ribonuclease H-like doma